jgi:hypothetical protein
MSDNLYNTILFAAPAALDPPRSAHLLARIKIETRWLLIATREPRTSIKPTTRAELLAALRSIRAGRPTAHPLNGTTFYQEARRLAETFADLIAARREREHMGRFWQ